MRHRIVHKREGHYAIGPLPHLLPDGRLAVGFNSSPFADHFAMGEWIVLVSDDRGETFRETDDPTIPLTWPGKIARERYDRVTAILPDGTYLSAAAIGCQPWPTARRSEAEAMGFFARPHPNGSPDELVVGAPTLVVQRSRDKGQTWERREWDVPGFNWLTGFPRGTQLADGTIMLPLYGRSLEDRRSQTFVWRSSDGGESWRLIPMASSIADVFPDELALFEVAPGRVLALIRHATHGTHLAGYLLESWSDDGGLTWSHPLRTDIKGYPPSLLRLQDGRILCCVTYRWPPMGIRAVLSNDNGRSWDTERTIVLREDAGTPSSLWKDDRHTTGAADVGYPITVQFPDGTLFTTYWITEPDGITHIAATTWRLDEVE